MTTVQEPSTTYTVPIGPIHPALKEPIRINLEVDGEEIVGADIAIGHVHRGVEWIGMNRNNPVQSIYLAERICGICNTCHPYSFVMACEQASGIVPPPRAEYIRVIVAELERIHSHLLWAGVAAHEIGFDSAFYLAWRVREDVMDLIEELFGNRITKAMYQIGGVRRNITKKQVPRIREVLNYYKSIFGQLGEIFLEDATIKMRTKNVAILKPEDALKFMVVGPSARASGIRKDVRQDQPYSAYADLEVTAITPDMLTGEVVGDVYDRIIVRVLEIKQSIEIIEQCIEMMPSGELLAIPKVDDLLEALKEAEGEGVARAEAPRGEVIHYVRMIAGQDTLGTWKVRAPTYTNLQCVPTILSGAQIADGPIGYASLDPCLSCTSRAIVVDKETREKTILTNKELHNISVEKTRQLKGS